MALAVILGPAQVARAGPADKGGAPAQLLVPKDKISPDSPRASLTRYLELCRDSRFGEAAGYLVLDPANAARGALLARRLKHVLDRRLWLDLSRVSPRSAGDESDGLPPGVDEAGRIDSASAGSEAVLLARGAGAAADR